MPLYAVPSTTKEIKLLCEKHIECEVVFTNSYRERTSIIYNGVVGFIEGSNNYLIKIRLSSAYKQAMTITRRAIDHFYFDEIMIKPDKNEIEELIKSLEL